MPLSSVCRLLALPGSPWLLTASLQAWPLSPRGCLPFVSTFSSNKDTSPIGLRPTFLISTCLHWQRPYFQIRQSFFFFFFNCLRGHNTIHREPLKAVVKVQEKNGGKTLSVWSPSNQSNTNAICPPAAPPSLSPQEAALLRMVQSRGGRLLWA